MVKLDLVKMKCVATSIHITVRCTPRTGRRWNIDKKTKKYPWQSPYVFAGNNPILFIDIFGEEIIVSILKFYEGNPFPKTAHDFAFTQRSDVRIEVNTEGKLDIIVDIDVTFSPIFKDAVFNQANPNFHDEVETHEDIHAQNIEAAFNREIKIVLNGIEYAGKIDEIATAVFENAKTSKNFANLKGDERQQAMAEIQNEVNRAVDLAVAAIEAKEEEFWEKASVEGIENDASAHEKEEKATQNKTSETLKSKGIPKTTKVVVKASDEYIKENSSNNNEE